MPTYEYRCDECGKTFERFQSMNDEPLAECPSCRGKIRRLIGAGGGIIFKGGGYNASDDCIGTGASQSNTPCGRDKPCCGRDSFCGSPKCES
jgi:putative FmdB family regulatory protein